MTTEDTNPTPESTPAPVAPDAPETPPAEPVARTEVVTPAAAPPPSRRSLRPLGIAGAILGAVLLLFAGFAIGHWAVGNGHHDRGHRVQRSAGQRMPMLAQMLRPNAQGNNSNRSPLGGAMPNLQQLRTFLQGMMRNRSTNNSGGSSNSGSGSANQSQLDQLQKQVQQLQQQVQQLQSQLQNSSH